jgi:hypothetical protein
MHTHAGGCQLVTHVPPPGAALQREIRVPVRAVLSQPCPQRLPRRRADLTPVHQSVVVHVIKGDLLSVHVQTAYYRHWDLLELLKQISDAHINERLSRGGPHHMSSFTGRLLWRLLLVLRNLREISRPEV